LRESRRTLPSLAQPTNTFNCHLQQQQQHLQLKQRRARTTTYPDAPKLIPLSALDRYQEGADLRLFCSASAPKSAGPLHFEWRKDQKELLAHLDSRRAPAPAGGGGGQDDERGADDGQPPSAGAGPARRVRISMMDESASVLRITQLEADDSGNYTCLVRNQHGFDSSTVAVNVMGEWPLGESCECGVPAR
jgi:hypothetical protein